MIPGNLKAMPSAERLSAVVLILAPSILSAKYYTSAAFERPIHFTILTFLISGLLLHLSSQRDHDQSPFLPSLLAQSAKWRDVFSLSRFGGGSLRARLSALTEFCRDSIRQQKLYYFLLACNVLRAVLFWCYIRTSQCAWPAAEVFLPLYVLIADAVESISSHSGYSLVQTTNGARQQLTQLSPPTIRYAALAFAWVVSGQWAFSNLRTSTGTVCTSGWAFMIPVIQLAMVLLDAVALIGCNRVRQIARETGLDTSKFVSSLCFASAGTITLLSMVTLPFASDITWSLRPRLLDLGGLALDSVLAAAVLVCSLSLLPDMHPTSIAAVVSGSSFYGSVLSWLAMTSVLHLGMAIIVSVATVCLAGLYFWSMDDTQSAKPAVTKQIHRLFHFSVVGFVVLFGARWLLMSPPRQPPALGRVIESYISNSRAQAGEWQRQAAASRSLPEATDEYRRRYGIPPPPNFDKWYNYAMERNSTIIDDFTQIHEDLLPYWAVEPAEVRERTRFLLEHSKVEVGGMRISNGKVEQAADVPGTHRWMMNTIEDMIRPFAQWLPDMDIVINLGDESRVVVPFEKMEALKAAGLAQRDAVAEAFRNAPLDAAAHSFSNESQWPDVLPQPEGLVQKLLLPWSFTTDIRKQIYYDKIAPTCPPGSKARTSRWWDWGTTCADCARPHMIETSGGSIISDVALARDICHQPDVAGLNGFILSSCNGISTQDLYPIFSQGRASGFSDILYPSPWNYASKTAYKERNDPEWDIKINGMFWRGASTDGFAAGGKWVSFLRTRFVYEAYQQAKRRMTARRQEKPLPLPSVELINVTFSGDILFCHFPDCTLQQSALESFVTEEAINGPLTIPRPALDNLTDNDFVHKRDLPDVTPFSEHWKYRHLMDMDGAGFSGRFLTFLESRSLIYRANAFRAWFDERLQPWHHYVPVDIRLGQGFWSMVEYFAGPAAVASNAEGNGFQMRRANGDEHAKVIAEQGREWTKKVLRKEDMEIYMFRLLLEWGRLVDDRRDELGYQWT